MCKKCDQEIELGKHIPDLQKGLMIKHSLCLDCLSDEIDEGNISMT